MANTAETNDQGTATLYRSKPTTIEAVQWLGTMASYEAAVSFAGSKVRMVGQAPPSSADLPHHHIELLAGVDGAQDWVPVPVGHWLVSQPGDRSDVWPVEPDYFAAKYEPCEAAETLSAESDRG